MKKFLFKLLTSIALIAVMIVLVNVEVTTRQGVNYKWHTIRLPLYLKILDFYDRHFNYKQLVRGIIGNEFNETKKAMQIFSWTYHNIRKQPKELPIIDDHVWHIIVRGYGVNDQASDVFTTLCNYAGMDAFFTPIYTKDKDQAIPLSFVKIEGRWIVFDPHLGVYFRNNEGNLADIEALKLGNFITENIGEKSNVDYVIYFNNLSPIEDISLCRANTQSPINRFVYMVKSKLGG